MSNISKDGRFKISRLHTDSDDWYGLEWAVIDIRKGEQIHQLYGNIKEAGAMEVVEFSPDGKDVIGKDGEGDIVERFKLPTGPSSTSIIDAVEAGNLKKTRTLIEGGADVNTRDFHRRTALIVAAQKGHFGIAKLLLEKSADVNAKDEQGKTALIYSAEGNLPSAVPLGIGHFYTAKLLLEKGAKVNASGNTNNFYKDSTGNYVHVRYTALMYAAEKGSLNTAKLLIDSGAKVNVKFEQGKTALDIAQVGNHEDIVKLLEDPKGIRMHDKLMKLQERARRTRTEDSPIDD